MVTLASATGFELPTIDTVSVTATGGLELKFAVPHFSYLEVWGNERSIWDARILSPARLSKFELGEAFSVKTEYERLPNADAVFNLELALKLLRETGGGTAGAGDRRAPLPSPGSGSSTSGSGF